MCDRAARAEAEIDRLRKIEEAARWVRTNWDSEATQHLSMPALRTALDGQPGAPTRSEVLAANIVVENTALRADLAALREAAQAVVDAEASITFWRPSDRQALDVLRAVLASADGESREETP